jgi:hypothetical protein
MKLLTVFGVEILMHAKSTEAILISFIEQLKAKFSVHVPACKWFFQYLIDTDAIKVCRKELFV